MQTVDLVVREDSPDALELEIRAPATKRKRGGLVLGALGVVVPIVSVGAIVLVPHAMVLAPLALLLATALVTAYAPYSWLFSRIRVKVDSHAIASRYERVGAFFDANTFLDTVRGVEPRLSSKGGPLFGCYEVVALRSDMVTPWSAIQGLETFEQASDIAARIRARLRLEATTTDLVEEPNPPRPLGRTLIALAGSGLAATLASFLICLAVAPRGVSIAEADLLAAGPVSLQLAQGDRLRFYADVEVDDHTHPNTSLKGLESLLSETKLHLQLVPSTGKGLEQECVVYSGVAEHKSGGLDSAEIVGMANDCRFVVEEAGPHTLRATVGWSQKPRRATLRIHKE